MKLSRRYGTELPVTTEVISTVEKLEEKEKGEKESAPKDGVCFVDRNGKLVEEIFEETPDPVIYSNEEEEESVEENGIETENGPETDDSETVGSMVYDTVEEDTGENEENNVGSVEEELDNSVEDRVNDADTYIILQEEEENIAHGETEETEECEVTSLEVRRVGLIPKRPVTYDHRYDHTMTIILS